MICSFIAATADIDYSKTGGRNPLAEQAAQLSIEGGAPPAEAGEQTGWVGTDAQGRPVVHPAAGSDTSASGPVQSQMQSQAPFAPVQLPHLEMAGTPAPAVPAPASTMALPPGLLPPVLVADGDERSAEEQLADEQAQGYGVVSLGRVGDLSSIQKVFGGPGGAVVAPPGG